MAPTTITTIKVLTGLFGIRMKMLNPTRVNWYFPNFLACELLNPIRFVAAAVSPGACKFLKDKGSTRSLLQTTIC